MTWWDTYAMLDNIRDHSLAVTHVATTITRMTLEKAPNLPASCNLLETVTAAALLHDLAKTYCIRHGGNHAQVGAAWVVALTGNPAIGHAVFHHVFWPGRIDVRNHFIPLVVAYGDKRVRHNEIVSLEDRMEDLMLRYGTSTSRRKMILRAHDQIITIEQQLEQLTGVPLHAHSFDSRRLVQ
ncbi:HD domain-containing protein [Desulfoplanes formicivorans]|uniref:Phosphohydrolase n=1 Tax=Desulfoplanes formicivorans TaxID=1592317 RepID=A0A194AIK1_9BACT|nr:HD domain-containing protein [Desulfoplanes formicivorans]GAU09060.1 phosphohydrolase [Desulfoplanes formicivorans]